jgi:hypothetical protein
MSRMGGSAFDLIKVVAVVRHSPLRGRAKEDRVTVYLCDAVPVDLRGDDARAFLRLVESLPAADDELGPVGSRVAVVSGKPEGGEPAGRKRRG